MATSKQRLRVLMVDAADTGGMIYGGQQVILSLVRHLQDEVEAMVIAPVAAGPYAQAIRDAGGAVIAMPLRQPLGMARAAVAGFLQRAEFDLVHTHDLRGAAVVRPLAGRHRTPVVSTYHEPPRYDHLRGLDRWRRELMLVMDRRGARRTAAIHCVSQAVADDLAAAYRLDPDRLLVAHNGIELDELKAGADPAACEQMREGLQLAPSDRLVVTAGALIERKGGGVLLEAAPAILSACPEALLVFAGDGPLRQQWADQVTAMGLADRVRFPGFLAGVGALFQLAEVVVVPSLGEAFGLVAVEALALGRPVVASRTGGLAEIVEPGVCGDLVTPGDPVALAEAVAALLRDKAAARRQGKAGAERVRQVFTAERQAAEVLRLYRRLTSSPA